MNLRGPVINEGITLTIKYYVTKQLNEEDN